MNATECMAALNTVEQDHRLVLDKMRGLKEAVSSLLEPATNWHAAVDRLDELHRFFAGTIETHMQKGEISLFPLLEKSGPGGAQAAKHLRNEHTAIRRQLEEFGEFVRVADESDDEPLKVRDVLALGWKLWGLLDEHARRETQAVQQCLASI
jgi:iron-sulfur cluster repair protein YtfE (RIC family)